MGIFAKLFGDKMDPNQGGVEQTKQLLRKQFVGFIKQYMDENEYDHSNVYNRIHFIQQITNESDASKLLLRNYDGVTKNEAHHLTTDALKAALVDRGLIKKGMGIEDFGK